MFGTTVHEFLHAIIDSNKPLQTDDKIEAEETLVRVVTIAFIFSYLGLNVWKGYSELRLDKMGAEREYGERMRLLFNTLGPERIKEILVDFKKHEQRIVEILDQLN